MDPHKRSATIEVMAADEAVLGGGRYGTDAAGYRGDARRRAPVAGADLGGRGQPWHRPAPGVAGWSPTVSRSWTCRRNCRPGPGCSPPVRAARPMRPTRMRSRWSPPASRGLHPVTGDAQLEVLRVLADRRRALGEDHTRMVCQLHQLLAGTDSRRGQEGPVRGPGPGPAGPGPPAGCGRAGPPPGRRRADRRPGTDLPAQEGRRQGTGRRAQGDRDHADDLDGIGPSGAARLLVEAGDITRFPDRGHFASWNGTAPIDASSGDQVRHRLSRAGNRQINRVLHIMAIVQLRHPTKGRAYYDRKVAAGKTPMEAMRALKRTALRRRLPADDGRRPRRRRRAREDTRGRL